MLADRIIEEIREARGETEEEMRVKRSRCGAYGSTSVWIKGSAEAMD
jgi:putative lipoic acid-binding regulatory protein